MKKQYFLLASLALGMAACTNDTLTPDEIENPDDSQQEEVASGLTSTYLSTFSGDQSRVVYENQTRAEGDLKEGELKLIATINNPDKEVFSNYTDGNGHRFLSATSVFKNPTDGKYYVTYHMQGNNYDTQVDKEIAGAIQLFQLDETGVVSVENGYMAADRSKEDFDFNHLYFDQTDNRIVVVGHNWSVPSNWNSDEPYTGDNTRAIIGVFNPANGNLNYSKISTSIEVRDQNNELQDYEDAGDGNCVIRIYDQYYLATRKGIAVLQAKEENLFKPVLNSDKSRYFIPTLGSCKFVYDAPGDYTRMFFLYLSENKPNIKDQTSEAKLAQFKVATGSPDENRDNFIGLIDEDSRTTISNTFDFDIANYTWQTTLPEFVSPIDGKNGICVINNDLCYAALGKGGLYYSHFPHYNTSAGRVTDVIKFGNRPVNFVYAEDGRGEGYHGGYVYVANGARLTIIDRASMEEVASYTLSAKDGIVDNEASANYIHVDIPTEGYPFRERTITVAYGQAGVRIFKFMPKQSSAFPQPQP